MAKTIRKDATIKTVAKRLNIDESAIRNPNGRKARSDKKLDTLRKDYNKLNKK